MKTEQIAARARRATMQHQRRRRPARRSPARLGGVQFAQVAVDTETGVVKVERVVAVHDCGRPINPLGVAEPDQRRRDPGHQLRAVREPHPRPQHRHRWSTPTSSSTRSPAHARCRQIEPIADRAVPGQQLDRRRPASASPRPCPPPAAIANAVYNAIGVRIRELPMTPAASSRRSRSRSPSRGVR